jgi:hypothetical protein
MNTEIPDWVKDSLSRYVDHRIETGSFLRAVLENDLFEAINRADKDSLMALPRIVNYIHNNIRSDCYGSEALVNLWLHGVHKVTRSYLI